MLPCFVDVILRTNAAGTRLGNLGKKCSDRTIPSGPIVSLIALRAIDRAI